MKTKKSDFPQFFQAYLTAALWSSVIDEGEQQDGRNGDPFDKHFSTDDFNEDALETLRAHAFSFWSQMWYYIDAEINLKRKNDAEQAGHDFWLTQNGHGAGFWDGDWPTYGETLIEKAKCYPELHLYIDENGQVGVE